MDIPPTQLDAALARWVAAGLLDAERAEHIAAHEEARRAQDAAGRSQGTADGSSAPADVVATEVSAAQAAGERGRAGRRTRTAEAVGYVGAALAIGALGLILADLWRELTPGGRSTLAALVTVVTAAAATGLRSAAVPALQRLASVLAAAAVIGVAWTTGVVTADLLGWSARDVATAVTLAAVAAALPAYLARPRPLPQVVLLLSLVAALEAWLLRSPLTTDVFWYALPVVAVAGAWVLLGLGGWLRPPRTATTSGGIVALLALQCASFGDLRTLSLVLGVAIAAGAVGGAVVAGGTHHLAVGAIGLFVLLPQLVIEVFGDAIGAPATLLAVGLLLVVLAVGLGRAKREVTPGGQS